MSDRVSKLAKRWMDRRAASAVLSAVSMLQQRHRDYEKKKYALETEINGLWYSWMEGVKAELGASFERDLGVPVNQVSGWGYPITVDLAGEAPNPAWGKRLTGYRYEPDSPRKGMTRIEFDLIREPDR